MNYRTLSQNLALKVSLGLWLLVGVAAGMAQVPRTAVEVLRGDLKADRKAVIAEAMQFTEQESQAFWPLYDSYRAEVEKVSDRIVKLVFEYTDLYPNVPERKASEMLDQYTRLEGDLLTLKRKYLKKFEKVLPPSKVFRFAQVDNRYDLATRIALAAWIPIIPATQARTTAE